MATHPVPTLSLRGWAEETAEKADRLLAYFFTSDYRQSKSWFGEIASFQYTLEQHQHDEIRLRQVLELSLGSLLERYFDAVDITVTVKELDKENPDKREIVFDVKVQQGEEVYGVEKVTEIENSKVSKIFTINNG